MEDLDQRTPVRLNEISIEKVQEFGIENHLFLTNERTYLWFADSGSPAGGRRCAWSLLLRSRRLLLLLSWLVFVGFPIQTTNHTVVMTNNQKGIQKKRSKKRMLFQGKEEKITRGSKEVKQTPFCELFFGCCC